jgi:hypothetical protein
MVQFSPITYVPRDVARIRMDMENLLIQFERQYGGESEVALRAEQVCGAVQRLIWALEREHSEKSADSVKTK